MFRGTRAGTRSAGAVALALSAFALAPLVGGGKARSDAAPRAEQPGKPSRVGDLQKRPNVIVITTDDQTDSLLGMPFIERRFAKASTTFTNSMVTFPLCCPSRATMLTGQYAHNHGVRDNHLGFQSLANQRNTLPVWLRRAGYRTAHIGKYLNGYGVEKPKQVPPGWTSWQTITGDTDQRRWGYLMNVDGRVIRYGGTVKPGDYITDVLRRRAVRLITDWAPDRRPFFLWLTPTAPHAEDLPFAAPRNPRPAPRHEGRFEGMLAPRPPSFNEEDVSDKPEEVRDAPLLGEETVAWIDRRYASRLESLLSVDGSVRAIVRRLRKHRELHRTVIIFTSDNGLQLGEHRVLFKNHPYEESLQVPLLIRGPGFPPGVERRQLVSNVDLAPTIGAVTGARPRRMQDGRSLIPLAQHGRRAANRMLLFESFSSYQSRGFLGIRTRRYSYILRPSGEDELYDLLADPHQLESVHADPAYEEIRQTLAAAVERLRDCAGRSCG